MTNKASSDKREDEPYNREFQPDIKSCFWLNENIGN